MTRLFAIAAALATTTALAAGVYFAFFHTSVSQCSGTTIAGGEAAIGGPFTLVDQTGRTVTDKDVITDLSLVYFGYTFCPDVCPIDTARNVEVVDLAAEQGLKVTPVFITIDPARDTVAALADYAEVMHEDMIALTGSDEQVAAASRAYKTYYRKNGEGEDYLMDHSTFTYLMAPDGFLDFFRRDATPSEMVETIACYAAER